jgi:hypothetical protein
MLVHEPTDLAPLFPLLGQPALGDTRHVFERVDKELKAKKGAEAVS